MSNKLQCFLIIATVIYFLIIIHLLRREKFLLKYGILWLASGLFMLIIAVFPDLMNCFTNILGIQVASNGIFALSIFLVIVMLVFLTAVVTELTYRVKEMAQKTAIIEKRLRDMEDALSSERGR